MTKGKLELYRSILHGKKIFTLDTIDRLREMSQIKEADEDMNKHSKDDIDQSNDSTGKEEYFMLISREMKYLNLIENSLESIEIGKYGICKICGNEIAVERLEAVPTTDTCIKCKNAMIGKTHPV